ncbi:MAG: hypothetical protein ABI556_15145 [Gemmatimonadales bacterium]
MRRRFTNERQLVAILAVVGLIACRKSERAQGTGAAVDSPASVGTAGALATDGQKLSDFPNASGSRLDYYIDNVDLFDPTTVEDYARLTTVSFPCANCPGKTARFLVIPVDHAKNIRWERELQNSTANEAQVVSVFLNVDKVAVDEIKLAASDHMYLWMGLLAGPDARGVGLFIYDSAKKENVPVSHTKKFFLCTDPDHRDPKPSSQTKPNHTCEQTERTASGGPLPFAVVARPRGPDGLWISCYSGCCKSSLQ